MCVCVCVCVCVCMCVCYILYMCGYVHPHNCTMQRYPSSLSPPLVPLGPVLAVPDKYNKPCVMKINLFFSMVSYAGLL